MNNLNLSEQQMESMLKLLGQKLNKDPNELKNEVQSGKLDGIMNSVNPQVKAQIEGMANNPKAVEALLKNDKVRTLLEGFIKK